MYGLGWYHTIHENQQTMKCVQSQAIKQDTRNQIIKKQVKPHYKYREY